MDSLGRNVSAVSANLLMRSFWLVLFSILAYFVASRNPDIGTDTQNYIDYFDVATTLPLRNTEPGFYYLSILIKMLTDNVFWFFLYIYILVTGLMFISFRCFSGELSRSYCAYYLFSGILLFSSWYFVAVANGLRQGISLAILYMSLGLFFRRNYVASMFFLVISFSFHYSSFLILPFLCLLFFSFRIVAFFFVILSLSYPLGVNEFLVERASALGGVDVYSKIKDYSSEDPVWYGFNFNLFLYTVFWAFFFYLIIRFFSRYLVNQVLLVNCLKAYFVLCMPYFVFAFGSFSNRYGFIAWFFLPILQSVFILSVNLPALVRLVLSLLVLLLGILSFSEWFWSDYFE